MAGKVFVSGGSGYIAGFLIRQLIAEGWTVHTSIRDLGKEAAVRASLAVDDSKLKFFAADLTSDAGWAEAMAGCSHVAHVASPLPSNAPKSDDELIVPARDGALRALKAAKAAGVKRFVMTSSMAAIAYGHGRSKSVFTEADWTDPTSPDAYAYVKSKTIAERAARDWVAVEGGDMEFVTVNPALVLGPLQSGDFSTSLEAIRKLLDGSMPGLPNFGFGIVDDEGRFRLGQAPADRNHHDPCARRAKEQGEVGRGILAEPGHPIALLHAHGKERRGDPRRGIIQLAIGQLAADAVDAPPPPLPPRPAPTPRPAPPTGTRMQTSATLCVRNGGAARGPLPEAKRGARSTTWRSCSRRKSPSVWRRCRVCLAVLSAIAEPKPSRHV